MPEGIAKNATRCAAGPVLFAGNQDAGECRGCIFFCHLLFLISCTFFLASASDYSQNQNSGLC